MVEEQKHNYSCTANIFGSNGFHIELDEFRCFLTYFSVTLNQINFGYICGAPLIVIMLISIFGPLKEHYRWFILNQALWDLATSYSYICDNWIAFIFFGILESSCFYSFKTTYLQDFFAISIETNSYSALALFSFTRFLVLFFPQIYNNLTQNRRIFYTIFVFNFIIIFTNIRNIFSYFAAERQADVINACINQTEIDGILDHEFCFDTFKRDFQYRLFTLLFQVFSCFMFLKPLICLLVSLIAALLIMFKVGKQFKFQLKHNRKNATNSARICIVIFLQTLINLLVFIIECAKDIPLFLQHTLRTGIVTSQASWQNYTCEGCLVFMLPPWLGGDYGLAFRPVLQGIVQCRILIESLIILFIIPGYRESVVAFIKWIYRKLCQPKAKIRQLKSGIIVTRISSFK